MAQKTGIRQWTEQRIISSARVPFDPRRTDQVESTRDANNYKAMEKYQRTRAWEVRQAEARANRQHQAAE